MIAMSFPVPNYEKNKIRLARREHNLRRLIARGASREKLLKAALAIRDGRIRVLRAKQYQNASVSFVDRAVRLQYEEDIKVLQSLTAEAVLAEYLPMTPLNN